MSASSNESQTFFSTDIVKYQDQNRESASYDNGSFSNLALKRWLQVTIPLTALTLFGAWLTFRFYSVSAKNSTFFERLKRAVLSTTPAEAGTYVQMPSGDRPGTTNATNEGSVKRLGASISRFASGVHKFGNSRAVLPRYEGSGAKHG